MNRNLLHAYTASAWQREKGKRYERLATFQLIKYLRGKGVTQYT